MAHEVSLERIALALTRAAFLSGPTSDEELVQLRKETDVTELGLDVNNDEHLAWINEQVGLRSDAFRRMDYVDYLRTEHWQTVRDGALARAKYACQVCSNPEQLHVHHRTYDNLGFEMPADVTVLCAVCHQFFHDHRRLVR